MIPFNELLNTVRDLAGDYPDYITEGVYWDWVMGQPGCIVGTALYRFDVGVPLEQNKLSVTKLDWEKLGFTEPHGPALRWLYEVQRCTRAGWTWGAAVAEATKVWPFIPVVVA